MSGSITRSGWRKTGWTTGATISVRRPVTTATQRHKWLIPEEFHYDRWIAERSNALMSEYAENEEPFFLWSSFFDPHPAYLVPEPWDTMYDPAELTVPEAAPGRA